VVRTELAVKYPRHRWFGGAVVVAAWLCPVPVAAQADAPRLGRSVPAAQVRALDRFVMPDGAGLPPGSGDVATGAALYARQCANCHGPEGVGGSADELAGGHMALDSEWPDKNIGTYWPYATTVFDFIRRSMPLTAPGSLSADEVYALTAYLLWRNAIIAEDAVLDARSLARVVMPNRDGFIRFWPEPPAAAGTTQPDSK
jgi:cytochrome c